MLFSDHPRTHYRNAPAHEVICQLRFPAILTINNSPSTPVGRTPRRPGSPAWAAPAPRWNSSPR